MAKKKSAPTAGKSEPTRMGQKLAGKKLSFVGRYPSYMISKYHSFATVCGATLVDIKKDDPDIVIYDGGRNANPPGDVAKLQKRKPDVDVYELDDWLAFLHPTEAEFLAEVRAGLFEPSEDGNSLADLLETLGHHVNPKLNFQGADLRGLQLHSAHLGYFQLDSADLRGAKLNYTHLPAIADVKLDDVEGQDVYIQDAISCSFKNANLKDCWAFWGAGKRFQNCNFAGATITGGRLEGGKIEQCQFTNADLSRADLRESEFRTCDFTGANLTRVEAHKAKFKSCTFKKAKLAEADFREADLRGADLTGADLRDAIFCDADLTGAKVDGADFAGAVLVGATLKNVDFKKAKNYTPPVPRTAGPMLQALVAAAKGSKKFETEIEVDLGSGDSAVLEFSQFGTGRSIHIHAISRAFRDEEHIDNSISATNLESAFLGFAYRWPKAKLRLNTVKAKGSKTLRGAKLTAAAVAAWAEAFGAPVLSPEELKLAQAEEQKQFEAQREELIAEMRRSGSEVWNRLDSRTKERIDLRGVNFSGANLSQWQFRGDSLEGCQFENCDLTNTSMYCVKLGKANFRGATLTRANLADTQCEGANFSNAILTEADLSDAILTGANFTGATFQDVNFDQAKYDETTKWPKGFKPPESMIWTGKPKAVKQVAAGSIDFPSFYKSLQAKVDKSKLDKATKMLKAERFQLFTEVKDDSLMGVVKSQTDPDLVYSCRLASDGAFACCTQNLRPCGGLQGSLCKHLLVLIVGLSQAGQLDPATVQNWVNTSRSQKPKLDPDLMSESFLRYKGAEAGEIDWRPTETTPEDFYTM